MTKHGKCICFSEEDVRSMGRIAGGVRAIKLEKDDEVVAMELVEPGPGAAGSDGKRLRQENAGEGLQDPGERRQGTSDLRQGQVQKTGALIGAMVVDEDDEVLMINSEGIIIRIRAGEVSKLGRATQGVKIMKVDDDTKIVAMAKVIKDEDDEEPEPAKRKRQLKRGK